MKWPLLRLSVGLRSTLVLLNALVAAAMISLAMQAWNASQTQQEAQARQAQLAEALHLSKQADLMHDALRSGVQASLLVGQVPGLDQFEARQRIRDDGTTYYDTLQQLARLPLPEAMRERILKVSEQARLYAIEAHKVVQAASVDRSAAIAGLEVVDAQYKTVRRELDDLGENLRDLLHLAQAQAAAEAAASRQSLLWVCGLTIVAASALVALLTSAIRRRVRRLGEVAHAIADGDLERRVGEQGGDELAYLGQAIDQMADGLSRMIGSMRTDAGRAAFERQLAEALDMADSEQQVAHVSAQAMSEVVAEQPIELLIADSSRAHMARAAEHRSAGAPGCAVGSPYECVAVRRGTLVSFANSETLNACRHLRGRECGPTSAVCVPVTFMGRAIGVLHATAPVESPLSLEQAQRLGTLGAQVGMRIGTVRAFEKSQIQASTDGLTGLPNRRTLEQQMRLLARGDQSFSVVMCDLDHFKLLNDGHGHSTGDAALRIFADVLRHSLGESDPVGRWGGEEFAFVLTGTHAKAAEEQVDRLRGRLAQTLYGGKAPRFTVSFGIADSTMSRRPDQLIRMADVALYQAKAEGRDRACIADPSVPFDEPHFRRVAATDSEAAALYGDDSA
ncbi:MAG: diguanylate cyclase domain-containing protein [Caldimonas sp.]